MPSDNLDTKALYGQGERGKRGERAVVGCQVELSHQELEGGGEL